MCGIVGFFGDSDVIKFKAFEQLLYINALRGMDSTGIITVNTKDEVKMARAVGETTNLTNSREYSYATEFPGLIKVAVGHNRHGTGGGVSKDTAHPFDFENVIGVHNGVIGSKYRFDKSTDFKVDSQALYNHMNTHGVTETINLLGAHGNSYSLVFWDKVANTLNFIRNNERPMNFVVCDDNKTIFFASEAWMLKGVLERNGIKHGEVIETTPHNLYTFSVNQTAVSKPLVRSVEPPKFNSTVVHSIGKTGVKQHVTHTSTTNGGTHQKKDIIIKGIIVNTGIIECKVLSPFEIEAAFTDINGGSYVRCRAIDNMVDGKKTYAPFRLYYRKEDEWVSEAIGEKILSKVNSFTTNEIEGCYYKLSPWDVISEMDAAAVDDHFKEDEEDLVAISHQGQVMEISKWRRKYPACGWCSDTNLDPNRCTFVGGEALCEACSKDEFVRKQLVLN